jgi:hypothetical protein
MTMTAPKSSQKKETRGMSLKNRPKYRMVALFVALCVPLTLGATCTQTTTTTPTATTLVNETFLNPPAQTFNPSVAGKTITCTVTGNVTASRIQVTVQDMLGAIVGQNLTPTSNTTTVSFQSTSNGLHVLTSVETGTASSSYTLQVTEM